MVYDLKQVTRLIDGYICSLKTEREHLTFQQADTSAPGFVSRLTMRIAHGAKEWKSEGKIESDSPKHDSITFYSFKNRKNQKFFLIDAQQKEIRDNAIFTVPEQTFYNILNQLGAIGIGLPIAEEPSHTTTHTGP